MSLPIYSSWMAVGLAFLWAMAPSRLSAEPTKRLLLIGQGPDGHPAGTHEFMAGVRVMEQLLASIKSIRTTVIQADDPWPEGPGLIDQADGVVLFVSQGAQWMQVDPDRFAAFRRLAQRKGGLVALHWAIGAKDEQYIAGQIALLGATRGGPQRKYQILETDLSLCDPTHPITAGLRDFRIRDEFYYRLDFVEPPLRVHPLLRTQIDGQTETVCWCWERPAGGRSFGFVGLHFHSHWQRPEYRRLVVQAILWTLKLEPPKGGLRIQSDPPKE